MSGLVTRQGNDSVSGSSDAEVVYAGKGNDSIDGGGGDDSLFGKPRSRHSYRRKWQ
ncbi:hypothetical protein [Planktothrix agardhii]|uniref:hypothetical protein n=1 Tax=Planktothrix agardhii TaxID=1160 RepID=UPI003460A88D